MTKTLNQIYFSSTKFRIFFSATLGIRIFFQKKTIPPPPCTLNSPSPYWIFNKSNTTDVTSEAETAYSSGLHPWYLINLYVSLQCVVDPCLSFVMLHFGYCIQLLHCLSFQYLVITLPVLLIFGYYIACPSNMWLLHCLSF